MATVSITQLANGTTADANQVDANFNAIAAQINGNLDATNITPGSLTDATLQSTVSPTTLRKELGLAFVQTGLTIATSANLSTTVIAGVYYINGKRVSINNQPITVSASQDTYVDVNDAGTVFLVNVANNANAGMTITKNSDTTNALRIAKIVSSGTAIVQVLQGSFNMSPVAPNTTNWFGFDPIGNRVYNQTPQSNLIGYSQSTASATNGSSSGAWVLANSTPNGVAFITPGGRPVKISWNVPLVLANSGTGDLSLGLFETTVGTGTPVAAGFVQSMSSSTPFNGQSVILEGQYTPSAGLKTVVAGFNNTGTLSPAWQAGSAYIWMKAELM